MAGEPGVWTHRRFFELLSAVGPLRLISICGPSVFESLCRFERHGFSDGHMNAITPEYHWHVELSRFRFARSRDDVHARSGRRVLFLELAESPDARPFLTIYLHRAKNAEFDPAFEKAFLDAHAELGAGRELASEGAA
jgi:hypothetical protein